ADVAVVSTIHTLTHQGLFGRAVLEQVGLPDTLFPADHLEFYGKVNYLKGAILYSDAITTVSPTWAREITTPDFGAGLEGVLGNRRDDVVGILNGVDYRVWSPDTDPLLPFQYDIEHLNGKRRCKSALQHELGLPVKPMVPLRSEEHTSELQSRENLVCRLL